MTDLPVAITLGLAAVTLGILLATWRWKWAFASGLTVGLALASKHSALPGLTGLAVFALLAWIWHTHREGCAVPGATCRS
jgi:4-amino-4-deoxy-L-arabinose transferase-like glycosyltransferase